MLQGGESENPELLRLLPSAPATSTHYPDDFARKLFEALRFEIHYNKTDNTAVCRIRLSGET